jgi:hypothetical protein
LKLTKPCAPILLHKKSIIILITIDDLSADSSTTGSIAVGGIAYGVLDQSYGHDWFKITLDANTTYQITPDSIAAGAWRGGGPQLKVLNSASQ